MKKAIIMLLLISLLLPLVPISTSVVVQNKTMMSIKDGTRSAKNYPDWAEGGFAGVWGVSREKILGRFRGVYGHKGRIPVFAARWNTTNDSRNGYVKGVFGRGYVLGVMNLTGDEKSFRIIGLYGMSGDKFVARIMGWRGPPLLVAGKFRPFQ